MTTLSYKFTLFEVKTYSLKLLKNILFVIVVFVFNSNAISSEKFVRLKGQVVDQNNNTPLTNFSIKVVFDGIDSTTTLFNEDKFDLWLPANRKAKVYFNKDGYITNYLVVDASFIPEFAYKKKQLIEINVPISKSESNLKGKPFCVADFKPSETKFIVTYTKSEKKEINKNFRPPFPPPVETYKKAKPSNHNLETTSISNINKEKTKKNNSFSIFIQGILFADVNYCVFNERVEKANEYLIQLSDINKNEWGNVKPFDSPEYGAIVLKTLNREKSTDTLFAVASWIETTRLLMQSFTSNSKVIMSNKKMINLFKKYKGANLLEEQKIIYNLVKELVLLLKDLEEQFMDHMRQKIEFDMLNDDTFLKVKDEINSIYKKIIE